LKKADIFPIITDYIRKNRKQEAWCIDTLLFTHIGGSRLYGLNTSESDYDIRGICYAPKPYYSGAKTFEQLEFKIPEYKLDVVIYDIRKWIRLTRQGNPNVLESLYVRKDNDNVLESIPYFEKVVRPETKGLITKVVFQGFHGYAHAQLKKMIVKRENKTGRQDVVNNMGFDTKFASHGFRLVRQGAELLRTGNITFPRPDAEDLKNIRLGRKYGPEDLDRCIADWKEEEDDMKKALIESRLPSLVDFDMYENLLNNILDNLVT
jgi:uncharacterized protein